MAAPRRSVRMRDVAARASVSVSTVSHVINGTRYVAPETRDAVCSAIDELHYQVPEVVRRPQGKRILGLVITGITNPYMGELMQGVEQEATRAGYALFLCDSHDDPRQESDAVRSLLTHNVDGIVLAPTPSWESHALTVLRASDRPYVLVDRASRVHCDQVSCESELVTSSLIEHLLERGHRRIGMLAGIPGLSTSEDRIRGYERALAKAGIEPDPELMQCGLSQSSGGRAATLAMFRRPNRPTALFSANNAMTIGAFHALDELGLRIPADVALVAFDDFEWASVLHPALTTVEQPFHAMGAHAVQLLLRRLQDPLAPRRALRLPTQVAHRESCGCQEASKLPVV